MAKSRPMFHPMAVAAEQAHPPPRIAATPLYVTLSVHMELADELLMRILRRTRGWRSVMP